KTAPIGSPAVVVFSPLEKIEVPDVFTNCNTVFVNSPEYGLVADTADMVPVPEATVQLVVAYGLLTSLYRV
ncbi:hypothetical protein, partial [Escherichia coli]|uniref:hypothetical protein n=1 Tax=Escherichia coli TaxID=562 RepID=UPI001BDC06C3